MKAISIAVAIVLIMSALTSLGRASETSGAYELVLLDSSTNESCAYGINSYGFMSGFKKVNGKAIPYLWSPDAGFYPLSDGSGSDGVAYDINDDFEICGVFGNWTSGLNVFRIGAGASYVWTYDLVMDDFVPYQIADLPALVRDISNSSEVAGQEYESAFSRDIYSSQGYSGLSRYSYLFGVNDQGNSTGMKMNGSDPAPIFVEKQADGSYITYTGSGFGLGIVSGMGINESNQIVGVSGLGGFYWDPKSGARTFLGSQSKCYKINNRNQIVGSQNGRAFIWNSISNTFVGTDLNSLISRNDVILENAFSVNDSGQIVGQCVMLGSNTRTAYMLTPRTSVQPGISMGNNGYVLSWTSAPDHYYSVHYTTNMAVWTNEPSIYGSGGTNSSVVVDTDAERMFFRVFDLTP